MSEAGGESGGRGRNGTMGVISFCSVGGRGGEESCHHH